MILASAVHELFHILAISLQNLKILSVQVDLPGMKILTEPMKPVQEVLSAAAGPLGSLITLIFLKSYPELAVCGMVQGIYNLLPIYPSDGGRIVRILAEYFFPGRAEHIERILVIATTSLVALSVLTLCYLFPRWYYFLILIVLAVVRGAIRKKSCKDGALAVQ